MLPGVRLNPLAVGTKMFSEKLLTGAEIMSSSRRPRDLAIRENVPLQPSTSSRNPCPSMVRKVH